MKDKRALTWREAMWQVPLLLLCFCILLLGWLFIAIIPVLAGFFGISYSTVRSWWGASMLGAAAFLTMFCLIAPVERNLAFAAAYAVVSVPFGIVGGLGGLAATQRRGRQTTSDD